MPFLSVDKDADIQRGVDNADKELTAALEAERPDELVAKDEADQAAKEGKELPPTPSPDGHDWKARYGNLQKYIEKTLKPKFQAEIDTLNAKVKQLSESLEETSKSVTPTELPTSVEEVEALKKDSPAAYNAILTISKQMAERIVVEKTKHLSEGFESLRTKERQNTEEANFLALQKLHPDLDIKALETDEVFLEWIGGKSKRTQDALFENKDDVDAASDVLTLYKLEMGIKKAPSKDTKKEIKNTRKAAATDVNTSSGFMPPSPDSGYDFTESQIDIMDKQDPRWYDRNAEAIDKAIKAGRVLMDVSDPAGAQRRINARAA